MKVFISHSSLDKPTVRALIEDLPRNLGLWIDEEQFAFDMHIPNRLERTISVESDLVLAFLSSHSRKSLWVEQELMWACGEEEKRGVPILLPVLLENMDSHPGIPDLSNRHQLRVLDLSPLGLQASARKLERLLFIHLLNRLPHKDQPTSLSHSVLSSDLKTEKSNRILLIRQGSSASKKFAVIRCCPELNLRPTVVDTFCGTDVPFASIDSEPSDWERLLPLLEQNLEDYGRFESAVTFEELEVVNTARLAQYLGCERRLSVAAAKRCRDKYLARSAFKKAEIPQVDFFTAASATEAKAHLKARALQFPLIVKPRNGAASVGVERVNDLNGLESAFRRVREDITRVREVEGGRWKVLTSSSLLVEEYIHEGDQVDPREMSVEGVVSDGVAYVLAVHDKLEMRRNPPYFEPIFISPPFAGRYSDEEISAVNYLVHRAVSALGIEYGPFHAELRFGPKGPVILEIGARPGGGIIPESIIERRGVDIRSLALKIAAGTFDPVRDIGSDQDTGTCLGIIYPEARGTLGGIKGVSDEELQNRSDVFTFYPLLKRGHVIVQEELTWLLDVGVTSKNGAQDAYDRFCQIRAGIQYEIDGRQYSGRNLSNDHFVPG